MSEHSYGLKMRQSLAQFERALHVETQQDKARREQMEREIAARSRARFRERANKRSSVRFYLLCLTLAATAIIVAVVMLATLYLLLV